MRWPSLGAAIAMLVMPVTVQAQSSDADLAKQLANPVAEPDGGRRHLGHRPGRFWSTRSPDTTGIALNTESTYDRVSKQWTVPINLTVSHIFKFGEQPCNSRSACASMRCGQPVVRSGVRGSTLPFCFRKSSEFCL